MRCRKLIFALGVVVCGMANMGTSCNVVGDLPQHIDSDVDQALAVVNQGITDLGNNMADWKNILQGMESKLASDAQTSIRNEIANLVSGSIGVANAGIFCSADFIGERLIQALERIKAKLLNQKVSESLSPATCEASPSGIEYEHWQHNGIPKVDLFGYDLEAPLKLQLLDGNHTKDVTFALSRTSHYQVTINLGSNGVPLDASSKKIELLSGTKLITAIPVIQPVTPVCQTKTVPFKGEPITFTPPHVGSGDNDFVGHGPKITTRLTLSVKGDGVDFSLFMDARETKSDWTEVSGKKSGTFYTPEHGWKVESVTPDHSEDSFTYSDGDHQPVTRYPGSGPVAYIKYIGDTEGDDVGRTGETINFKQVDIELVQTTDCVSPKMVKKMLDRKEMRPETAKRLSSSPHEVRHTEPVSETPKK